MMCKRETGRRLGLISRFSRASIRKELSTGKESISMLMGLFMSEIGVTIKYLVMELILGLMVSALRGNG